MKQKAERDCMAAKYYQYAMQSSKHARKLDVEF